MHQAEIRIITPSAAHRARWEELYYAYAAFYKVPMDQSIIESVWTWIHDENTAFYALLAVDGAGVAQGFMHFREMPSPLRGRSVGFLDDLFVDPQLRGSGIVDALFAELNNQCKEKKWPFIRWITAEDNYRARGVYEKYAEKTHWVTYQLTAPSD